MNSRLLLCLAWLPLGLAAAEPAAEMSAVQALGKLAAQAIAQGELEQAQGIFESALTKPLPVEEKRDILAGLAALLEEKLHQPGRAAAVYEQLCVLYPRDPEVPRFTLRLGHLYRELGAFQSSINKLYSVLNASLRFGDGDAYRKLVQEAQFEIAQTYFASGDYPRAATYFQRLTRLDLPAAQKVEAEFRCAHLLFLAGDFAGTLAAATRFVASHPQDPMAAEAEYLVVQSLRAVHRDEEALREALTILRAGKTVSERQPEVWTYWRQKTGNDLANDLYARNDALHALTVYQALAELAEDPAWRWPAVYQIGLCFERLRQPERAAQAYQYLLAQKVAPAPGGPAAAELTNLQTLREMATWRAAHLQWAGETAGELAQLALPHVEAPPPPSLRARPDLRPSAGEPAPVEPPPAAPPPAALPGEAAKPGPAPKPAP